MWTSATTLSNEPPPAWFGDINSKTRAVQEEVSGILVENRKCLSLLSFTKTVQAAPVRRNLTCRQEG